MDSVVYLVNKLKNEIDTMKDGEGCIICYSYPGSSEWKKTNSLFTNFCNDCDVVLCKDCCTKINEHKCPICHKKSDMFNISNENVQILQRSCGCDLCVLKNRETESLQKTRYLEIQRRRTRLGQESEIESEEIERQLVIEREVQIRLQIQQVQIQERIEIQEVQQRQFEIQRERRQEIENEREIQRRETRRLRNKRYRQRKRLLNLN